MSPQRQSVVLTATLIGQTWVDSDGVPKNTTISSDYIHYAARGVVILGLRMAKDAETAP